VLDVVYHRAKLGGVRISPAAGVAKMLSFCLSVCLSVCLFVRHAFERQRFTPDFAMTALEYRNNFDADG